MEVIEEYPRFLGSEIEQGGDDAYFHIIPIPYERTVSYGGGTAKGPSSILKASWQLEMWDGKSRPCDLGIRTGDPVECSGSEKDVMDNIAAAARACYQAGAFPVGIGGEHSVTPAMITGLIEAGLSDFGVVQIDAHADLRHAYEGNPLSHASAMRRIVERDIPLFQLGVRAYCEEEIDARKTYAVHHLDADVLVPTGVSHFELPKGFPDNVFFTLDIDGMDPSVFPSTGTPVPGGLLWYQTLSLFESVAAQRQVIGFDVVEFAPISGFHAYEFAASQLIYKMMGIVQRHR